MTETKTKTFQKVPSDPLRQYMEEEGLKSAQLAEIFGLAPNTPNGWIGAGKMPKIVLLALEGLQRRKKRGGDRILICVVPQSQAETVTKVVTSLGGRISEVES